MINSIKKNSSIFSCFKNKSQSFIGNITLCVSEMADWKLIKCPKNEYYSIVAELINGYTGATKDFKCYQEVIDMLKNFSSDEVIWMEIRYNYRGSENERLTEILSRWINESKSFEVPNAKEIKSTSLDIFWKNSLL